MKHAEAETASKKNAHTAVGLRAVEPGELQKGRKQWRAIKT